MGLGLLPLVLLVSKSRPGLSLLFRFSCDTEMLRSNKAHISRMAVREMRMCLMRPDAQERTSDLIQPHPSQFCSLALRHPTLFALAKVTLRSPAFLFEDT